MPPLNSFWPQGGGYSRAGSITLDTYSEETTIRGQQLFDKIQYIAFVLYE